MVPCSVATDEVVALRGELNERAVRELSRVRIANGRAVLDTPSANLIESRLPVPGLSEVAVLGKYSPEGEGKACACVVAELGGP